MKLEIEIVEGIIIGIVIGVVICVAFIVSPIIAQNAALKDMINAPLIKTPFGICKVMPDGLAYDCIRIENTTQEKKED